MAPLANALQVSFQSKTHDGTFHYICVLDPTWAVATVPHGGYCLGLIVEACIQHQTGSSHPDPVHVSAHFLRAANVGTAQVYLKVLKSGRNFTNILAELVQQGTTKITAHLIFGDLQPGQGSVLAPPSPYARRLPLYSHPSFDSSPVKLSWEPKMEAQMAVDAILLNHNDPSSPKRTTPNSVGGGGVEWGAWLELTHEDDKLTTSSIPFFCDSFINLPWLLPESEQGHVGNEKSWFPTITMTIEFKARIPSSNDYSTRTIGSYYQSQFQNDPQSRHSARVEVWTAPSEIGQGDVAQGWRDRQYCIAIADHMSVVLPTDAHARQGVKGHSTRL